MLRFVGLILLACTFSGCSEPRSLGPAAYDFAKGLYSVANQKSVERLDTAASRIDSAEQAGEITSDEARWLGEIIAEARDGNWGEASSEARALMEEQIER